LTLANKCVPPVFFKDFELKNYSLKQSNIIIYNALNI